MDGSFNAARSIEREAVRLHVSFTPQGAANVTLLRSCLGIIKSCVRTAAGKHTLTFSKAFPALLAVAAGTLVATGGTPWLIQINEVVANPATGGATVNFTILQESAGVLTPTDVAAATTTIGTIVLDFLNTGAS